MIFTLILCVAVSTLILVVLRTRITKKQACTDAPVYYKSMPITGILHLLSTDTIKLWNTFRMVTEDILKQGGVVRLIFGFRTCYVEHRSPHLYRDIHMREFRHSYSHAGLIQVGGSDNYALRISSGTSITDPEDAYIVANSCLQKYYVYNFAECIFGDSLLTAPVPIWTRHRKLLNPAFSLPVIHGFMEIFNDQAKILVDKLHVCTGKGPLIATSYLQRFILKISFLTGFGGSSLHNEETFEKYLSAINKSEQLIIKRVIKFWLHNDLIFKLCGLQKKLDEIVKPMNVIADEIVQRTQSTNSNLDDRETGVRSFLDLYLQIGKNHNLTIKQIKDELKTTIGGAFHTTAIQLETILILLGTYPKIQKRVYNEIILAIGHEKNVDKEDLHKLVYTDAVIKEALRLLPVTPIVARTLDRDIKLTNCTLRAGAHVGLLLYGINRHSSWGSDADQFRPDRWLEQGGVPDSSSAFATFSIGKRGCIGKTYALTSLKVTLAHLIRRYRIEADYTKVQYKFLIFLKPASGHEISFHLRNTS